MIFIASRRNFPCPRCNGEGKMIAYRHVAGGVCFRCGGDGIDQDAARSAELAHDAAAAAERRAFELEQITARAELAKLAETLGREPNPLDILLAD